MRWRKHASDHAANVGSKPWKYLPVPHDEINESKRLAELVDNAWDADAERVWAGR